MTTSGAPTVYHPSFSKRSLELGRAVITLKRQYESIARNWPTLDPDTRQRYGRANMAPQIEARTGKHVYAFMPDNFIFSALGLRRWHHACYESDGEHRLMQVDPWTVAGGFRKPEWLKMPPAKFLPLAAELNDDTVADRPSGSSSHWLSPFALLWAGEGKNRVQLYQDANSAFLTRADTCRFLPPEALRLYRSVLNSSVWLIRYLPEALPPEWAETMTHCGRGVTTHIIPFPEVAIPLLAEYGVKVDRGWGFPWRINKGAQDAESRAVRSTGWS